jgi:hypothetical protein
MNTRTNMPGWIGLACLIFMWLEMLAPKSMKVLLPVFDKIGPFYWLVPLARSYCRLLRPNVGPSGG